MTSLLRFVAVTLAATTLGAALAAPAQGDAGFAVLRTPATGKVDAAVRAALDTGSSITVLVLGTHQLLDPRGGLQAFVRRHDAVDRRTTRQRVLRDLKRIAAGQQRRILRDLGYPRPLRSLWMVNALALRLTPAEVRRAAQLPDVAFIYPLVEEIPASVDSTGVQLVLPVQAPNARPVFAPGTRRIPWNLERLNVPSVWKELGVTGRGARVAVLDFGTNYAHADLRESIWRNPGEVPNNRRDDDGNGYVDDYYGFDFAAMKADMRATGGSFQHGTVTAGIVGGNGAGGIVTGVAPDAELMLMVGASPAAATLAYQYAAEHGADVVSMSFSVPDLANLRGYWRMLSDHAVAAGLLQVGGAGNFRTQRALPLQIWSPKDAPSVIAMAGVDSALVRTGFSSGGPVEWSSVAFYEDHPLPEGLRKPDLVAFPGPHYPILGPLDSGYVDPNPATAGNSLSGPQGAGVAALILSVAPWMPVWRVREVMERTARDLGPPGPDNEYGAGLLDAWAAVMDARRQVAGRTAKGR